MNDLNKLSHTTWNCKYHVVCARNIVGKCFTRKSGTISTKSCVSCTNTAENKRVIVYGISERQKQSDDIRMVEQHQIQVSQQGVLV